LTAAIERILLRDDDTSAIATGSDSYASAKAFLRQLVDLRFCHLTDALVNRFIRYCLQNRNVDRAIDELKEFYANWKPKSLVCTLSTLLSAVHRDDSRRLRLSELVSEHCSPVQRKCLQAVALLEHNEALQLADTLHSNYDSLKTDEIELILKIASNRKLPTILQPLIDLAETFQLPAKLRDRVYSAMIMLYGRDGDIEGLAHCWTMVRREQPMRLFIASVHRIRHYYTCLNTVPPEGLLDMVKAIRT